MELNLVPATSSVPDAGSGCGDSCGCRTHAAEVPVLDVRVLPRAVRHAAVLGALEAVGAGSQIVLVAPHDPLPLLAEIEQRWPSGFTVGYDERGPEAWNVRLTRGG